MENAQARLPSARRSPIGTCLIVEDSAFDSQRMTRILNRSIHPHTVAVASTLSDARDMLAAGPVDLILLDNNLPDGLGADFALELSRDSKFDQIPMIMVSDWPSPFMFDKAQTAGVHYVVSKTEFDSRYVHAALKATRKKRRKLN